MSGCPTPGCAFAKPHKGNCYTPKGSLIRGSSSAVDKAVFAAASFALAFWIGLFFLLFVFIALAIL